MSLGPNLRDYAVITMDQSSLTRRHLLKRAAAFSAGFAGLHTLFTGGGGSQVIASVLLPNQLDPNDPVSQASGGYGGLLRDPEGIFELPKGFSYSVVSRRGDVMNDGFFVPGQPDGMAAFPGPTPDTTIIVRNHELPADAAKHSAFGKDLQLLSKLPADKMYDAGSGKVPACGGTTTVVYNTKTKKVEKQFLSLAGTINNCAGGAMPWGAWLTCEEDSTTPGSGIEKMHGYVFEVPASAAMEITTPRPITAMGRFRHEACCMDPRTGVVYLTEDREDGLIYRYLPTNKTNMLAGGTLQALCVVEHKSLDTSNHPGQPVNVSRGSKLTTRWMNLEEIDAPKDDLRLRGFSDGAAKFARNEGMWFGHDSVFFAATTGGKNQKGQLWKYIPSEFEGTSRETEKPGTLELFVEPNDAAVIENADTITVAPWGDIILCEDEVGNSDGICHLLGVTPAGEVYKLGRNVMSKSELAGATFSPDGSTLFVNIQGNGLTLAITGPWKKA